jgi:hypothetical protein
LETHAGVQVRRDPVASERRKGVARVKELLEPGSAQGVAVEQQPKEGDALRAHAHVGRQSDRLALDVAEQIELVLSRERRLARDHLEQYRPDAPQVGLGVVAARQERGIEG